MNVSELEQIIQLVQNANIHELTLRHNGARVTIRKSPFGLAGSGAGDALDNAESEGEVTSFMSSSAGAELPEADAAVPVTSPLVGTFRPAKNSITLGALVEADQVIAIIEAMKLPNEVTAPCAGKVVEVLVEDGQFVEYGQELFAIEPEM